MQPLCLILHLNQKTKEFSLLKRPIVSKARKLETFAPAALRHMKQKLLFCSIFMFGLFLAEPSRAQEASKAAETAPKADPKKKPEKKPLQKRVIKNYIRARETNEGGGVMANLVSTVFRTLKPQTEEEN